MEIQKVRKQGRIKLAPIPKKSEIQTGDYVLIRKIDESLANLILKKEGEGFKG